MIPVGSRLGLPFFPSMPVSMTETIPLSLMPLFVNSALKLLYLYSFKINWETSQ